MLTQSHIFIAKKVSEKLDSSFSQNYFYAGNIAPDFLYAHKKRKHEYRYSSDYLLKEISLIIKEKDRSLISYKMGVINHYLADFFCKAHNFKSLINNPWEHFRYELLLHSVLISCKTEIQLNKNIINIEEYIQKNYESYLKEEPSVVTDILYALEVCQNVMYHVFYKAKSSKLKETA